MRTPPITAAMFLGAGALVVATVAGCHSNSAPPKASPGSTTSATSTTSAASSATSTGAAADYTGLLIKEADIVAPEPFTAKAPMANPNGQPGVATSFSNPDGSHVIGDTILILPDSASAAAALDAAKAALGNSVSGTPQPAAVGTGGTSVTGHSPDGTKSVTVLLFTEGKAFTTLEFDGPAGADAPSDFVTDFGQKQDAAIKAGLPQ